MAILNPRVLVFVAYVFIFLPLLSIRSRHKLTSDALNESGQGTNHMSALYWSLVSQCTLLLLAWLATSEVSYSPLVAPETELVDWLYALGAFAVCLGINHLASVGESESEKRQRLPTLWSRHATKRESALKWLIVLASCVAEEVAFRGVGYFLVVQVLTVPWVAAVAVSLAFGFSHSAQGWRSLIGMLLIGLTLQGLVALTNTLVFAMVVHAAYNTAVIVRSTPKGSEVEAVGGATDGSYNVEA